MAKALAVLVLAASSVAAAAQQPAPPPPIRTVTVPVPPVTRLPFAPPAGSVVSYRITRAPMGPGAPPPSVLEQELRFESRPEGGYLLTIATLQVEQDGKTYRPGDAVSELLFAPDAVALLAPVRLVLGSKGDIQRIEGFEDYRSALRLIPELATEAAKTEEQRRAAAVAGDNFLARIASISAEEAARPAAGIWAQIFGYGELVYDAGKPREWSERRELAGGRASVTYQTSLTVTEVPGGGFMIERTRRDDPDHVAEGADALWSSGTPQALAEARMLRANGLWLMDYTHVENAKVVLDRRGMPTDVTIEEYGERGDDTRGRMVTTIELMKERRES